MRCHDPPPIAADTLRETLVRLVAGMTGLRDDGTFHEPNLDGTAGNYLSFDAWEWPQGVGMYGLVQLWMRRRDPALRARIEDWYKGHLARGLPGLNINTTAPMLGLAMLWAQTRDPRWQGALDDGATRLVRDPPRTPEVGLQHDVSDRVNPANCGTTRCSWQGCSWRAMGQPRAGPRCWTRPCGSFWSTPAI